MVAGLTVAIVALPLSMAIASGVTPDRGLYAAIVGGFLVSTLGGNARRIADGGTRPQWSPDGTQIAYATGTSSAYLMHVADSRRIYVVDANGGEPRRIVPDFARIWYMTVPPLISAGKV